MLKRCPSCQASVLDDSATNCPFCGSPMDPAKAKGYQPAKATAGSAAPKNKATATSPPGTKPTSAKPGAVKASATSAGAGKSGNAESDDPFAVRADDSHAIPLSSRRTAGQTNRVVCPMCETAGYAPEKASGKEVRCANPRCLVPVFRAPDFAAPKPVEPEPTPSFFTGPTFLTFAAVLLILAGGAGYWFFVLKKDAPADNPVVDNNLPVTPTDDDPNPVPVDPGTDPDTPAPTGPTAAETLASLLAQFPEVAQDAVQQQRKLLRRRYAAESYAIAGQPDAAREQLQRLDALPSTDPFYKISPLVELAWLHRRENRPQEATAAFQEALALLDRIPRQGFDPGRVVIDFSAAAAEFGAADRGRQLATAPRDDFAGEQFLALLRSAELFNAGRVTAEQAAAPLRPWESPKATAATFELVRRQRSDQARDWAGQLETLTARTESRAAWAETTSIAGEGMADLSPIAAVVDALTPLEQAYIWSRVAVRLAVRKLPAATDVLARATKQIDSLEVAAPFSASSLAELNAARLPAQDTLRLQAAAAAEAAHAAALLDQKDDAWRLLGVALQTLRAAGPSPSQIAERADELDQLGIDGVQSRLQNEPGISSEGDARRAANEYRRKLREVQTLSQDRFDLQTRWLAAAVGWGLGERVLEEAKNRAAMTALFEREQYVSGEAGGRIGAALLATGQSLPAGVFARDASIPPVEGLRSAMNRQITDKRYEAAARELSGSAWVGVPRGEKMAIAVAAGTRLAAEEPAVAALNFSKSITDELVREEVLRTVGLAAARAGRGPELAEARRGKNLVPTEDASLMRGLVEGLVLQLLGQTAAATPSPVTTDR